MNASQIETYEGLVANARTEPASDPDDGLVHGDVRSLKEMTDRQRVVLRFVHAHTVTHGNPPTLREIGAELGIRSTNGVNDHIRALERRGLIVRRDMITRSIRITVEGLRALGEAPGPVAVPSSRLHLELIATRNENVRLRMLLDRVLYSSVSELPKILESIRKELGR